VLLIIILKTAINNKMKLKQKKYLLVFCFIFIIALSLFFCFYNLYLRNVIISGPINIELLYTQDTINSSNKKNINVFGFSPTGKSHSFVRFDENKWKFEDYSNFRSIYITSSEQINYLKEINITTIYSALRIENCNKPFILNLNNNNLLNDKINYPNVYFYNITNLIKGEISHVEVIRLMLQWRDVKILFVTFSVIIFLIFIFLKIRTSKSFVNKNKIISLLTKIRRIKPIYIVILISLFVLLFHLSFYLYFGQLILTTGLITKISIFVILYVLVQGLAKYLKKTKKIRELKLLIASTALSLCCAEFVLLVSGYTDTYIEKRNNSIFYYSYYNTHLSSWYNVNIGNNIYLQSNEFRYSRSINSIGLSDIEHPIEKEENEYRIIGLGDSFTEGDGAHADSTWLKFLERSLNKHDFDSKLTFMNAGVCGSDPFFEYVLLRDKLLQYKPDLVILAINRSEIHDIVIRGGWERFLDNGSLNYNDPPWWEPIFASSRISRLFFYALGYNDMLYKHNDNTITDAANIIVDVLYAFNELATKNRFHLTIVFHPFNSEVDNNEMELKAVKDSLKTINSFDILDMLEYFTDIEGIKSSNSINYYWPKDGHHNAKGYEAFARGVEWHLNTNGILDSLTVENNY
jgi:lysophospholipase L1-like esterase